MNKTITMLEYIVALGGWCGKDNYHRIECFRCPILLQDYCEKTDSDTPEESRKYIQNKLRLIDRYILEYAIHKELEK